MLRLLAPAGTKLTVGQLWRTCVERMSSNGTRPDPIGVVASRMGVRHAYGFGSGRAALSVLLKAMHTLKPDRNVVVVPGYTCFSVPAAAVHAGLKVHPVEIDPLTLDFDREALEHVASDRLLCIVATNLFGLMNDSTLLESVARAAGAFVVDDAAQAFGSTRHGKPAGSRGDAGIYSMGRGKPLFGMGGGLVVTQSDEIAEAVGSVLRTCPEASAHSSRLRLELLAYHVFFQPRLYRIADSLPFLKLGVTVYDPSFSVERLGQPARKLLSVVLENVEELNAIRRRNAAALREKVRLNQRFSLPEPLSGCDPVYTRVPALAEDENLRDRAMSHLRRSGIGASPMYPTATCDIPGLRSHLAAEATHCPRAEQVARNLFTLPTHSFLTDRDVREIARVLAQC